MSFAMWGSTLQPEAVATRFPMDSCAFTSTQCPIVRWVCMGLIYTFLMRPLGFNVCQRQGQAVCSLYKSQLVCSQHTVYLRQYNLAGLIQSEPSQHFHTALYFSIHHFVFTLSFVKSFHVAFVSISDDAAQKSCIFFSFSYSFLSIINPYRSRGLIPCSLIGCVVVGGNGAVF